MWWYIIKSSRNEAYAEFVREFGPEVELDSLTVNPYEDEKQVQIFSSGSGWVVNYEILSSGKEQFTFESMSKYGQYENFVEGMFETEYPERYQELLDMASKELRSPASAEPPQDDLSELVGKYLNVSYSIMKLLRTRIREADIDERVAPKVLSITNPGYVSIIPRIVIPKLDASAPTKSGIVFAITELMVDKMVEENPIFRDREVERRVNALTVDTGDGFTQEYPNGFRDALTTLYYELLTFGSSVGRRPHMVFNTASDNAAVKLIAYLEEVVGEYLEEEF